MESAKERETGLLHHILPPRLEDAGLEDCALPPESIKEAFFKAASAVKSRVPFISHSEDEDDEAACVKDPWPTAKDVSDAVTGIELENEPRGPCPVERGAEVDTDEVKVVGGEDDVEGVGDKVVVGEEGVKLREEGKACVDNLKGLDIKDDVKKGDDADEEGGEREGKRPTLVEGFV